MVQMTRRSTLITGMAVPLAVAMGAGVARAASGSLAPGSVDTVSANALTVMATDPRLTQWMQLIRAAHMENSCSAAHPYTVFPLTDASFDAVPNLMPAMMPWQSAPSPTKAAAFGDTSRITAFVRRHVVEGRIDPSRFAGKSLRLTSLDGQTVEIDGHGGVTRVTWQSAVDGRKRTATLDGQPISTLNAMIYVLSNVTNA